MRIAYTPNPPPTTSPEEEAILDRIRTRRGSRGLTTLDLALLHSPPVADGWNTFVGAIRTNTSLTADIRELVICRVAYLHRAWYEWRAHAPIAVAAGVSQEGMDVLRDRGRLNDDRGCGLDERQRAAFEYATSMVMGIRVPDEVFDGVRGLFNDREILEMTVTIGQYIATAKLLTTLDIGEQNDHGWTE
ncbi:hypothetical protein FQN54_005302 [Arachnomyces sp. PD_36]|nr:hypothetical protein FQN54_005302 [Arachnomyces sp. PD_36]